jgi:ubiquinol-cytochrome c reductase iron-sulfur subunit
MRILRRIWLAVVVITGVRRRREAPERVVEEGDPDRRGELTAIWLLLGATACAVVFLVIYAASSRPSTQLLGLTLGGALALVALACYVASRALVVTEEVSEDYPEPRDPAAEEKVVQVVTESGSRVSRKRFLKGAAGAAGAGLGAALVAPAASFGPALDTSSLYDSPWRRGRRLVEPGGNPYRAEDIEIGSFYTALPEDADPEEFGSPLIVVRLPEGDLNLPADRSDWAPGGILAYSKVCTHAGCTVGLYRKPLFPPAEPAPALVCPCHYSTFDPATGGAVIYGPAGRDLPQLPLEVDSEGWLRAAGDFSGPVGPSFWGVRTRRPS